MGALRRIRQGLRTRRRTPALAGLAAVTVLGATACEPGDGVSSVAVAITTDQVGTRELERQGVDVQWVSCTASYGDKAKPGNSPSPRSVANVDCVGETKDGKDISIKGKVTQEVNGKCVRGDLTAKVGGKQWFRVDVLGNCDAAEPSKEPPSTPPGDHKSTPPVDHRTTPPHEQPGPTVTVTVTVTEHPRPTCSCAQGK
ncbi:hypothetical protein [Streptomyces montanus]|uniref:hypothetical protein n=1 Tax=Streptomyces montanus TaxID=2580423 RepID=UPI001FE5D4AB|nr:hypothetical protein [Streptomyces montanus]